MFEYRLIHGARRFFVPPVRRKSKPRADTLRVPTAVHEPTGRVADGTPRLIVPNDVLFRMIVQSMSLQVPRLDDMLIIMETKNRKMRGVELQMTGEISRLAKPHSGEKPQNMGVSHTQHVIAAGHDWLQ